jgi:NAD dependent epimerase/dehydratase
MNWKGLKVLVTGAEGFIGSHLTEALVQKGAIVTALIKNNFQENQGFIDEFEPGTRKKIKVIFSDVNDYNAVADAVRGNHVIFHLAAEISVPYSYVHPRIFVQTNIIGTFNVLMACKGHGVKKLIHMSTSEVYGTPEKVPIREDDQLKGQSPYSASKISAEKLAESFFSSYGLPVVVVRTFNTYGPRQSARAIIPTLITQALFRQKIFMGNDKPTRDFNFVLDTVHGLIKVAENSKLVGQVVNIGSGKDISVGELAKKILQLTGSKAVVVRDPKRLRPKKSEVMKLRADNSKIRKFTGWKPETNLDDGLKQTIAYIAEHPHLFKTGEYQI